MTRDQQIAAAKRAFDQAKDRYNGATTDGDRSQALNDCSQQQRILGRLLNAADQ